MVDVLTKKHRSWNMGRVRGKNTKPELLVRSVLHRNGYRFRLHAKNLPGKPDIVLAKHRTAVFVHGCFWHRHERCPDATTPKSHTEFWIQKFTDNVKRDVRNQAALRKLGWTIIIVWECETTKPDGLAVRLRGEINKSSNKLFTHGIRQWCQEPFRGA